MYFKELAQVFVGMASLRSAEQASRLEIQGRVDFAA